MSDGRTADASFIAIDAAVGMGLYKDMLKFRATVMVMALGLSLGVGLGGCATTLPPHMYAINQDRLVAYFPDLPADAQQVAERVAACLYWGGEIAGDHSQRDVNVNAALRELHCVSVEQDKAAMRSKYVGDARVQQALDKASHWFANQASIAVAWA